ncbi:MAG TPA: dethiobiotin synthase [Methylophilaceae bacterium]|nr:dethiobiotin synthase [Methylophilaceae bacterium]
MKKAYFVTGTDTGVGKTLVTSALLYAYQARGMKTAGMKPVAAGCVEEGGQLLSEDVAMIMAAGNVTAQFEQHNPYAFAQPIAPHIAAQESGEIMRPRVILNAYNELTTLADVVIVEGVGGFRVPLSQQIDTADLAQMLNVPIILVVGMRLGCINHTLLTVEAIQTRGLELAGWVANKIDPDMAAYEQNLQTLDQFIPAPCFGVLPYFPQADFKTAAAYLNLPV